MEQQINELVSKMEVRDLLDYLVKHKDDITDLIALVDFNDDREGKLYSTQGDDRIVVFILESSKQALLDALLHDDPDDDEEDENG